MFNPSTSQIVTFGGQNLSVSVSIKRQSCTFDQQIESLYASLLRYRLHWMNRLLREGL